jgi:hypothetical protein
MKKFVSILCILLLLVATSNLAVNIHFCGDSISSVSFIGESKTCGGACDSETGITEKSCCKNFSALFHTDDTTNAPFSFQTAQQTIAVIPAVFHTNNYLLSKIGILYVSISCHAPPTLSAQPYYILYRSLII